MAKYLKKPLYIIISILSGYAEFGIILYMLKLRYPAIWIAIAALVFQIGNLVPVPVKVNKHITRFSIAASFVCFAIVQCMGANKLSFMLIGIALLSVSIQSLRSSYAEKTGTTSKRISRVLGFLVAPFFSIAIVALVSFVLMIFTFIIDTKNDSISIIKPKLNYYNVVMIIHQMHYFSYTYFLIIILYNLMYFSALIICLAFSLSWITYILIGYILNRQNYRVYFIVGHTYLFIVLLAMYLNPSGHLYLVLWICTGFCAGTIFALNKLDKEYIPYDKNAMDYAENIGHILGTLIGIPLYVASKSLFLPIAAAAVLAFSAALSIFLQPYLSRRFDKRLQKEERRSM